MYTEDELLPLSDLQHILFYERQCVLIHIEQKWRESGAYAHCLRIGATVVVCKAVRKVMGD